MYRLIHYQPVIVVAKVIHLFLTVQL